MPIRTILRLAGLSVHVAHGGAHLFIRIRDDVLHQKIQQARFTLQDPQNLYGPGGGPGLRFGWRGSFHRHGFGISERLSDIGRQRAARQYGEERAKCVRNATHIVI